MARGKRTALGRDGQSKGAGVPCRHDDDLPEPVAGGCQQQIVDGAGPGRDLRVLHGHGRRTPALNEAELVVPRQGGHPGGSEKSQSERRSSSVGNNQITTGVGIGDFAVLVLAGVTAAATAVLAFGRLDVH